MLDNEMPDAVFATVSNAANADAAGMASEYDTAVLALASLYHDKIRALDRAQRERDEAQYERDAARRGVQQLAQALRDAGAFTGEHDALVWSAMCPRHAPEE